MAGILVALRQGHQAKPLTVRLVCPKFIGRAHSGVIGNEGADACAEAAAVIDTTDISQPDVKNPFGNSFQLSVPPTFPPKGTPKQSQPFASLT
eukprot:1160111-Pelagomonas_calceolata.AAC.17